MRAGKENGIVLPSTPGASGQVLISTGPGTLGWNTPLSIGGSSGDVQFNSSTALAGASSVKIENGYLRITTGLPTTATGGGVIIGSKDLAGRIMPAFVGPSGLDCTIQPHLGRNRITQLLPVPNTATYTAIGQAVTTLGTATARTLATTNFFTSLPRVAMVGTANLSGSIGGWRTTSTQWWRGNTVNTGGFFYSHTFGISNASAQANGRAFVGLISSTSQPSNVEPTTLVNCIGMARLNANTTWGIYGSDASAAGTAGYIDLGSNFPANTINTDVYRLTLFAPPGASFINYRVERLNIVDASGAVTYVASGTITDTNLLPANSVFLAAQSWVSTGSLTGTAGIDMVNFYVETDV